MTAQEEADELRMTALHEAGHFVMSAIVGGMPRSVTIAPEVGALGHCGGADPGPSAISRLCGAMHALAGGIACDYLGDDYDWLGVDGDIAEARALLGVPFLGAGFAGDAPFADIDWAMDVAETMTRRIMSYRRVLKAVLSVTDWLLVTTAPSEDEIAGKYCEISRRVGFLRRTVYHWIASLLGDRTREVIS